MATHDIIVIGASVGGIEALQSVLSELPRDLPAAVLTVVHSTPKGSGSLPDILGRVSAMQVAEAREARSSFKRERRKSNKGGRDS